MAEGILVFGAVFCVSAFMAGRDYLAAKKEADAFDSLSKLAADYAEEKAPADLPVHIYSSPDLCTLL